MTKPTVIPGQGSQEGEEDLLLKHMHQVAESRGGRYAVHLHLSKLKASNRTPHFLRIAARSFENLESSHDAALFRMTNQDLVLSCRDVPIDEIDEVLFKVRTLFSDDPMTAAQEGSLDDRFTTWYDLAQEEDLANFKKAIANLQVQAEHIKDERERAKKAVEAARGMAGKPLTPKNLVGINQILQSTRISDLVRQQAAVRILPPDHGEILFREYFVSMADLQKRVAPNVNLFSSNWLFQYLTETVDKRMLVIVGRLDFSRAKGPISLNLNISTVLSQEFQNFHHVVGEYTDKVVVEIQLNDIFADVANFHYAREILQSCGYRVLIDGLTPLSLQFFDPGVLMADYVKITWGPEYAGDVPPKRLAEMHETITSAGKDAVVLTRVDSETAIKWGLKLGIQRFQGYFVDKLVERMVEKGIV